MMAELTEPAHAFWNLGVKPRRAVSITRWRRRCAGCIESEAGIRWSFSGSAWSARWGRWARPSSAAVLTRTSAVRCR